MLQITSLFKKNIFMLSLLFYSLAANAADTTGIAGIDEMVGAGQNILKGAARWGGILTVVIGALALGSGRLQGTASQTICKILIVIGLLMAAFNYFGQNVSWGFSF